MRFLKKMLVSIYLFLAIFAVVCLVLWIIYGDEPETLIMAVFGAAGIESVIGGMMKIIESKSESKDDSERNEKPPRKAE